MHSTSHSISHLCVKQLDRNLLGCTAWHLMVGAEAVVALVVFPPVRSRALSHCPWPMTTQLLAMSLPKNLSQEHTLAVLQHSTAHSSTAHVQALMAC